MVLSCGPPYLFGFTVTTLNGAELYETTLIELAKGVFAIKYSDSPSAPKVIGPSLRAASTGVGFSPSGALRTGGANPRGNHARFIALGEHDFGLVRKGCQGECHDGTEAGSKFGQPSVKQIVSHAPNVAGSGASHQHELRERGGHRQATGAIHS